MFPMMPSIDNTHLQPQQKSSPLKDKFKIDHLHLLLLFTWTDWLSLQVIVAEELINIWFSPVVVQMWSTKKQLNK